MSEHSHTEHHHVHGGPKVYLAVLLGLLVLTLITVGASRIDFGSGGANVAIALFIATVKATLVALWFMHLKYDKAMNSMIFLSTLFFLSLFFAYPYIDMFSRPDLKPSNWKGVEWIPDSGRYVQGTDKYPKKPATPPPAAAGGHSGDAGHGSEAKH
jgi:cytochrome c oxidase subunit 4